MDRRPEDGATGGRAVLAIAAVRLGSPRAVGEGLRIGTVRRPPRGVKKAEYAARDYYDVWLPELAPSEALLSWGLSKPWTDQRWATFTRRYRGEMAAPGASRLLALLAALARTTSFSIGCYCEGAERCHRSLLLNLLQAAPVATGPRRRP